MIALRKRHLYAGGGIWAVSIRAIVSYKDKTTGEYVAKYSHYGDVADYYGDLLQTSFDDIKASVDKGDSSEPLTNFYSDRNHCLYDLGWDDEMYKAQLDMIKPRRFKTFKSLRTFAHKADAEFIYVYEDDKLNVYEYCGEGGFVNKTVKYRRKFKGKHHVEPKTRVICKCPICGDTTIVYLTFSQLYRYERYKKGVGLIQDVMYDLDAETREQLKTGICPTCWDEMFGK